ncbi:MAG: hypothetical protein H0U52_08595 [Chloroflexi bacterium]|nr:hypothetical protein [Chloroflexota bacterium]
MFGRGRNPINFVAAADVAAIVEEVVVDADGAADGTTIEVVGPANVTFDELVAMFARALGRPVPTSHVPRAVLRAMAIAFRPFKPVLADQIAAAITLDSTDMTEQLLGRDPASIRRGATTFDDVIRRRVTQGPAAAGVAG